jgi:hypothetical protein
MLGSVHSSQADICVDPKALNRDPHHVAKLEIGGEDESFGGHGLLF